MSSLRTVPARRAISSLFRNTPRFSASSRTLSQSTYSQTTHSRRAPSIPQYSIRSTSRAYATESSVDANSILEDLQEQYATARDEFEIATEETEKKTVYAADDRAAAREELNKLKKMFEEAAEGPNGVEVKQRVGNRVRELENAVTALEESALED